MNPALVSDAPMWALTQTTLHLPALTATVRLGLIEALDDHALTVLELSERLHIGQRAAHILTRFLGALGFVELGERVSLTPVGRKYLLRSSTYFWGPLLERMAALPLNASAIERASLRDESAIYGDLEIWTMHAQQADHARTFAQGAHCRALETATRLAQTQLLRGSNTFLDVGGGMGTYSVAFAAADPLLAVTLLDIEPVCRLAADYARSEGVGGRVAVHPADMFSASWPSPVDVAFLSDVLHDFSRERGAALVQRAFDAVAPGGRVLLNEVLLDEDGSGPLSAISYDLAMLFSTREGRQYRFSELAELLTNAGFVDVHVGLRVGVHSVISGMKPAA